MQVNDDSPNFEKLSPPVIKSSLTTEYLESKRHLWYYLRFTLVPSEIFCKVHFAVCVLLKSGSD